MKLFHILAPVLASLCLALAACSDDADAPPPPDTVVPAGIAPTITQQPADVSVTAGQPATFDVTATGDAPLAYQWMRGGTAIEGATTSTYALTTTTLGDSGASFTVDISNGAGHVTSNAATLAVTASGPVLTITQQPAGGTVVVGSMATFTVAATCSSGTLDIQWQRGTGGNFANISGATSASYSFATSTTDDAAQFRAMLDCSGQSAVASSAATLGVTATNTVTSSSNPVVGLEGQADITDASGILQEPSGSYIVTYELGVKRLSADLASITPVAGNGANFGSADGVGANATFHNPESVARDSAGNLYVVDSGNHTIRRVAPDGTVTTIAGQAGAAGTADGTGSAARFTNPTDIALGPDGDLYVADLLNHRIRRVTTAGVVTTYAGSTAGMLDGTAATAQFNLPTAVAVAANGDVLVSDANNSRVRRILRAGNGAGLVETLAGSGSTFAPGNDGIGAAADIIGPSGITVQGNVASVLDASGLLRQIDLTTRAVTTLTGSRTLGSGYADGTPTTARLAGFGRLTPAAGGGFMTTEQHAIRFVSATGNVRTIATDEAFGVTAVGTGVLLNMPLATFEPIQGTHPVALARDPSGNLIIGELAAQDVRRIDSTGAVTPIAGLPGSHNNSDVDGTGSEAQFANVQAVSSASDGVIYVADARCVRRIGTDHAVTTLAGSCPFGIGTAVDGNAATARFGSVNSVAAGPNGDVFVADAVSAAIRRIDAAGNVTTYMGAIGQTGTNDGSAATARLQFPSNLAFAADGALIVADFGSLRRIAPDGSSITTLMPTPNSFASAGYIAVDTDGTIYFGGATANLVAEGLYKLTPGASTPTLLIQYSENGPVLGSAPDARVGPIVALTLVGPKQLVIVTGGQLMKISVP